MNQLPLINYLIAHKKPLPACNASMYEFILAGNGVFIRAVRDGLSVIAPLVECNIPGLEKIEPEFHLEYPLVTRELVEKILQLSQQAAPNEILFHLYYEQAWKLKIPAQINKEVTVTRLDSSPNVLIEIHSHHVLPANFSVQDDSEESGFKIYGVIGTIFSQPTLRLRVGIYHQVFWEIPAYLVFDIPTKIYDATLVDYVRLLIP
ncbi:hypothetical protein H6S82_00780 [Planktothrix sp. FACHB-1355]|uniref:JAB domain-containing protein n=1 Tax=Aerosakkonema funiforme FACHB-1375 TaxID=2949571 RepID=A0A926ZEP8_9CYAN|nr:MULTISPECIES: hypothetical protein [Oscillatoriales]MBD2180308.1 hypothetical protein [Aerosakkonema funiforme FACHB-1375]MBD3557403.1 hypothetical protein [Planktothrix sp. FACHB-1355]